MAQVELVCGPYRVVSLMSAEAAAELGLEPGLRALASVKSTNVVVERAVTRRRRPRPCARSPSPGSPAAARAVPRGSAPSAVGAGSAGRAPAPRPLTVLAAASLTGLRRARRGRSRPSTPASPCGSSFDSSATLAQQAAEGAPADVLATADAAHAWRSPATRAGRRPAEFATNALVLVTPADNPADVSSRDLDPAGVTTSPA